jgi:hypothetical protein
MLWTAPPPARKCQGQVEIVPKGAGFIYQPLDFKTALEAKADPATSSEPAADPKAPANPKHKPAAAKQTN